MISHTYRCIFIHIPRCAGSSIERWICGKDWWEIEPRTKHLLASQAKALYGEWWDSYFKFAVVRAPLPRMISCLRFPGHFGVRRRGAALDLSGYRQRFGSEVVIEHDHRFHKREDLRSDAHKPGQVYGNILDERIDFVARYETLAEDMEFIREELHIPRPFDLHLQKSRAPHEPIDDASVESIRGMYQSDLERFGYATHALAMVR